MGWRRLWIRSDLWSQIPTMSSGRQQGEGGREIGRTNDKSEEEPTDGRTDGRTNQRMRSRNETTWQCNAQIPPFLLLVAFFFRFGAPRRAIARQEQGALRLRRAALLRPLVRPNSQQAAADQIL